MHVVADSDAVGLDVDRDVADLGVVDLGVVDRDVVGQDAVDWDAVDQDAVEHLDGSAQDVAVKETKKRIMKTHTS